MSGMSDLDIAGHALTREHAMHRNGNGHGPPALPATEQVRATVRRLLSVHSLPPRSDGDLRGILEHVSKLFRPAPLSPIVLPRAAGGF